MFARGNIAFAGKVGPKYFLITWSQGSMKSLPPYSRHKTYTTELLVNEEYSRNMSHAVSCSYIVNILRNKVTPYVQCWHNFIPVHQGPPGSRCSHLRSPATHLSFLLPPLLYITFCTTPWGFPCCSDRHSRDPDSAGWNGYHWSCTTSSFLHSMDSELQGATSIHCQNFWHFR